jgi:hypothetical protein
MVQLQTVTMHPCTDLLSELQQAYQEEQRGQARTRQVDAEHRTAQWQDELIDERAAIEAQMTKLHHSKSALEPARTAMIDFTKARAQARDVVVTSTFHKNKILST